MFDEGERFSDAVIDTSLNAREERPSGIRPWLLAARPKTLPAAAVPVVVGTALAARLGDWHFVPAALCLVFALLVQVGTNLANDYFDFIKGADTHDRLGPTRMVASGAVAPKRMLRATGLVFGAAFLVGIQLVWYGGWWLIGVGSASILFGYLYTAGRYALAYNGLGDIFVFVFFGLVAVGFTFYVQTGFFAWEAWAAGAAVGALAVNILTVNNYRDRETDARSGKRTLAVRFGRRFALGEYLAMGVVAFAVPVFFFWQGYRATILLPWLLLPVLARLFLKLRKAKGREANAVLAKTAALLLGYGALFSVGVLLG